MRLDRSTPVFVPRIMRREYGREGAAQAQLAPHFHGAVVQLHQLLGDDEAQARARVMPRGTRIQLLELPEQLAEILLADPYPLVDHLQADAALGVALGHHRDLARRMGEL